MRPSSATGDNALRIQRLHVHKPRSRQPDWSESDRVQNVLSWRRIKPQDRGKWKRSSRANPMFLLVFAFHASILKTHSMLIDFNKTGGEDEDFSFFDALGDHGS